MYFKNLSDSLFIDQPQKEGQTFISYTSCKNCNLTHSKTLPAYYFLPSSTRGPPASNFYLRARRHTYFTTPPPLSSEIFISPGSNHQSCFQVNIQQSSDLPIMSRKIKLLRKIALFRAKKKEKKRKDRLKEETVREDQDELWMTAASEQRYSE